jgi:caffeoyl-CoA O-methyltransferase
MVFTRNEYIGADLGSYVADHATPLDGVVAELRSVTAERTGDLVGMQIGDDQALFFEILAQWSGARRALEIGTFTGMSALALARGMGPEGRLICLDVSEEWTAIALEFWARAGVADRIDLRIGPALDSLESLEGPFDLVFIDADKVNYVHYYEAVLPKVRPGGLLLADNTLQGGRVLDPGEQSPNTVAMRQFNDRVVEDDRVRSVLLPIADGVTIVEKL